MLVTKTPLPKGSRPSASVAVSRLDVLALGTLLALWAALLLFRYDALPLQLWDESRNANNALEMALHGRWLTPTYEGLVDHWNTKPPLLIWSMAALMRLGLPILVAVRLTSWFAAAATALMVWGVLRFRLKDRLAAFAGGVLLLSAVIYIGAHGARTGDYDAPESACILAYVVSIWMAFETGRPRWIWGAALCMALGVLTKGVAALLPLPGVALFALSRPARLGAFLRNVQTWAAAGAFLLIAGGYYLGRENYDPGYLRAVAANELGGRFLQVSCNHRGGWDYYLRVLVQLAEPCTALCVLGLIPLFGRDGRRRSLVLASGLAALSLLLVLSLSKSKMQWYAMPLVPLISLIAGLGLSDALRWVRTAAPRLEVWATAGALAVAAHGALFGVSYNLAYPSLTAGDIGGPQYHYGEFLEASGMARPGRRLTVVDAGFRNPAGFDAYNPMLKFEAERLRSRGLDIAVVHAPIVPPGEAVASCDPGALTELRKAYRLQVLRADRNCLAARVLAAAT